MNLKLEVADFDLKKVKFNAKKGLIVDFYDVKTPNDLWNCDSDGQPHEDYHSALNSLKEVFAYSLGLNNGWDFARENNRKNAEALDKARKSWDAEVERCVVTGVTVVGSGENKGIKISGSLKTDLGVVGCASPTIKFEDEFFNSVDDSIMIGDLAETALIQVQEEVWKFIFQGKRGGELFPAEEKPESGLNGVPKMAKVG